MNDTFIMVMDDDKQHFDMKVGSENIKKSCLARDNCQGMACYAVAETSINFFLDTEHERANDTTFSATLTLIEIFFSKWSSSHIKLCSGSCGSLILGTHSTMFLLGVEAITRDTVKITLWVPFVHAHIIKEKRDYVNGNGVCFYKAKKLKVIKDSGARINASCHRNGNGSGVLGLDSHLESNSMRWYCTIKDDSHHKNHKNDTHSWCDCMQ